MAIHSASGLTKDRPLAVVCGRGNSSRMVTALLSQMGFEASSVLGGMAQWMNTLMKRHVQDTSLDGLYQFDRVGKGSLAYLLVSDGEALVIDAPRNLDPIVAAAEEAGATIKAVLETHVHADYISGGPALAKRLESPITFTRETHRIPTTALPGSSIMPSLATEIKSVSETRS